MKIKYSKNTAVFLFNLLGKTWRIQIKGNLPEYPAVIAFWHGEMMPLWQFFAKQKSQKHAIVSVSKDGELLAALLEKWSYSLIRGSSSKNGKEALAVAVEKAKDSFIFITPDGPRGPAMEFKNGAAIIAFRSSVPLYTARVKCRNAKFFPKSWDNFMLPLPFAKIVIYFSDKNILPANLSNEEISQKIKEIQFNMNNMI